MWWRSPVLLVCLCLTAYFGFHAVKGQHGLEARAGLVARHAALHAELTRLETLRGQLRNEVLLLSEKQPDPDYVDEMARELLGYVRPREVILLQAAGIPSQAGR